jgi:hypothetical protein
MRKQKLSGQDLNLLRAYFDVRNANPCNECLMSPATCCGCKEQAVWLEKFKAAEALVKDVDAYARVLFENYITCAKNSNQLNQELETEKQNLFKICDELGEYLDPDTLKDAGLL